MNKRRISMTVVGLTLAAWSFTACGKSQPAPPGAPSVWTIGMSQCNLGEPWRVQMNQDIRKAAESHPELRVVFKDSQNDSLKQRSQIEEYISAGVDLIIVSPKEAAPLTAPVAAAFRAGIPIIVLDRRVLGNEYTCFIGADNKRIGRAAGEWVVRKLGGSGRVVELKGLMTSTPGQDRHSGFHEGIKDSGIEIIFEADMKWLEPDARKEMESALSRFPKIDLVYAHNDPGAHGAYLAALAAGREKDILFVGIDGLPHEGQVYVKQGLLTASFEYPTGGREAVRDGPEDLSRTSGTQRDHSCLEGLHAGKRRKRRRAVEGRMRELSIMKPVVDIYIPLDARPAANASVWPVAVPQLAELVEVIQKCGGQPNVLNPDKPVSSVAEGMSVIRRARGDRFIAFIAGWAYPDFSVSPMGQLPADVPKLMLGSAIPDFPGAVGLLAAVAGTAHVGIPTSRLFVEDFADHTAYCGAIEAFLKTGVYRPPYPGTIDIPVTKEDITSARDAAKALRGMIYGAVGPRSMQMWNKISEADFLRTFGIAREGFDGLRLLKMAEAVPDGQAEEALHFLLENGMRISLGDGSHKGPD